MLCKACVPLVLMFHSSFYNKTVLVLDVTQVSKTEAFSLLWTPEHGTYCINYYILHMNINNKVCFVFLMFFCCRRGSSGSSGLFKVTEGHTISELLWRIGQIITFDSGRLYLILSFVMNP